MAAALMDHAAAALRRGFLLMGVLAIVAGFLGMHVITGMHGAHAMAAVTSSTQPPGPSFPTANSIASQAAAHAPHAGTAAHDSLGPSPAARSGPELTGDSSAAAFSASCACPSNCTDLTSMHSACVPSAAVTSLAAPPPGMAPSSIHIPDNLGDAANRAYSFLPASPSPGDLSISRT
ncbi:hypothetical protein ACFVTM_04690 [Arthrobacter sp. NPDC058130]|uniref:hypothetical protein n=1 Tax=Arthrobacter sp. NPDC058130 TaxID=3346353 RepID=UPI0036E8B3A7